MLNNELYLKEFNNKQIQFKIYKTNIKLKDNK